MSGIVILHPFEEKDLAKDLAELLQSMSDGSIRVQLLSELVVESNVTEPQAWKSILVTELSKATHVIIVLTPRCREALYIWWMYGLVWGLENIVKSYSIGFGARQVEFEDILIADELFDGLDQKSVECICNDILSWYDTEHFSEMDRKRYLAVYSDSVRVHVPPKLSAEKRQTIWMKRFENCSMSGRLDSLHSLVPEMYRDAEDNDQEVSFEVHYVLSEMLTESGNYLLAAREADYVLEQVPGDLTMIHRRIMIHLHLHEFTEAKEKLNSVLASDWTLRNNPEFAGLEGRLYSEIFESDSSNIDALDFAIKAYKRAYNKHPENYYVGGNIAILLMMQGRVRAARNQARRVNQVCKSLQQRNQVSFWNDFTEGAMQIILANLNLALEAYARGLTREPPPSPRQIDAAIARGVDRLAPLISEDNQLLDRAKEMLNSFH